MSLRFGTDGMRGAAHAELTTDLVTALGRAGAEQLGAHGFAIGRDTRASGPDFAGALHRGVVAAGGTSVDLGVVPTPTVARWCAAENAAGAMVSASHNPWTDNGVKLFAPGGRKLTDDEQHAVQARFDELLVAGAVEVAASPPPSVHEDAVRRHVAAVVAGLEGRDLAGRAVVIDVANGAAIDVGPAVFRALGADVTVLHNDPDGENINAGCGSTDPSALQAAVRARPGAIGVAFDGDADRVVAVDETGGLVDGDHIIAMCAIDRAERGRLPGPAVVVTVMANLGFRRAMAEHGIELVETPVGDRYVLEALEARGLTLGGEQSGHVIFRDLATTGDGVLTATQLLDVVARSGRSLAELSAAAMTRLPQVLQGVPLERRRDDLDDLVADLAAETAARLGTSGRVLVRPSGTEPLVRVMVEADDAETAEREATRLSEAVRAALG